MINRAIGETSFTLNAIAKTYPLKEREDSGILRGGAYAQLREDAGITLARAYTLKGEFVEAQRTLSKVRSEFPRSENVYAAYYFMHKEVGNADEALRMLEAGDAATEGRSAQLNYFLGIAYLDRSELKMARKHADKAYALRYPLPGLRNRLAAAEELALRKAEDEKNKPTGATAPPTKKE